LLSGVKLWNACAKNNLMFVARFKNSVMSTWAYVYYISTNIKLTRIEFDSWIDTDKRPVKRNFPPYRLKVISSLHEAIHRMKIAVHWDIKTQFVPRRRHTRLRYRTQPVNDM
jgi:hypothetical protein